MTHRPGEEVPVRRLGPAPFKGLHGSGGGGPTLLGLIDFKNAVYQWGGSDVPRGSLVGVDDDGFYVFDAGNIGAEGYDNTGDVALLGNARDTIISPTGCIAVFEVISANGHGMFVDIYDANFSNTDIFISVGNSVGDEVRIAFGGQDNSDNSTVFADGVHKIAFRISAADGVALSLDGGAAVVVAAPGRPVEPEYVGITMLQAMSLRSVKLYSGDVSDLPGLST